jgi:uncharacterized membrane protein
MRRAMTYPNDPTPLPGRGAELESIRTTVLFVWGLYALGLFVAGVPTIAGIILAYVKRGSAVGTIYESHFNYAISTFWISILITIVGSILFFIGVGWIVWALGAIWYVYRIIRGGLRALNREPIT